MLISFLKYITSSLLFITWCWQTFMFALSQTRYLFKDNLKLLANTSTPGVAQYHLEKNLTTSCLRCWSTGLTGREIPMQYYTRQMHRESSLQWLHLQAEQCFWGFIRKCQVKHILLRSWIHCRIIAEYPELCYLLSFHAIKLA